MLLSANAYIKVLLMLAILQSTLCQRTASALLARSYCPGNRVLLKLIRSWFWQCWQAWTCSSVLVLHGHQCKGCSQHITKRHLLHCTLAWGMSLYVVSPASKSPLAWYWLCVVRLAESQPCAALERFDLMHTCSCAFDMDSCGDYTVCNRPHLHVDAQIA